MRADVSGPTSNQYSHIAGTNTIATGSSVSFSDRRRFDSTSHQHSKITKKERPRRHGLRASSPLFRRDDDVERESKIQAQAWRFGEQRGCAREGSTAAAWSRIRTHMSAHAPAKSDSIGLRRRRVVARSDRRPTAIRSRLIDCELRPELRPVDAFVSTCFHYISRG
jgi:hypothetical protein